MQFGLKTFRLTFLKTMLYGALDKFSVYSIMLINIEVLSYKGVLG